MKMTTERAAELFAERLATQTDVADVQAAMTTPTPGFVLVDTRSAAAWAQGHLPGAVHLPGADIAGRAAEVLDPAVPVVTYCWGPGATARQRRRSRSRCGATRSGR